MKPKFYPVNKPKISYQDIFKLAKTARKQYVSGDGLVVEEFEEDFRFFGSGEGGYFG